MYNSKILKKESSVYTYIHMNRKLAATTICYCNLETFVQGTFFRKVVVTSIIEGQESR